MEIIHDAKRLRQAIRKIQPTTAAVAYIGKAWQEYAPELKEVVLSPTLGSNPWAIREMIEQLGVDNVHFFTELHAKIYLGENAALVGSANLTSNGFGDGGLQEMAILIEDPINIAQLREHVEQFKSKAKEKYLSRDQKMEILQELERKWNIHYCRGLVPDSECHGSPTLSKYLGGMPIHLSWYVVDPKIGFDNKKISKALSDKYETVVNAETVENLITENLCCLKDDPIQAGDWVLCWHSNGGGEPRKNGRICWMYVHLVVPDGADSGQYTNLAVQMKNQRIPPEPFTLDEKTKGCIREALTEVSNASTDDILIKFAALLAHDSSTWKLSESDKVVGEFIEYIREKAKAE